MKIGIERTVSVEITKDVGHQYANRGHGEDYTLEDDVLTCSLRSLFVIFPPEKFDNCVVNGDIEIGDPRVFEPGSPGRAKVEC